jgi:predicted dehydrogenase
VNITKVLFIGLGGAGQRHLRILKQLLPPTVKFSAFRRTAKTPLLRSDFSVDESNNISDTYGLTMFNTIEAAFEDKPTLTVISTPTSCHKEPLLFALKVGSAVIVEKPWAEDLNDFESFRLGMLEKQLPFLISFQRRYHPLITKTNELLKKGKIGRPMLASFTVFSDVTTWHSYEDWRNLYAVRKDLGGGVLLTEIHEIDLAYMFFGVPKAVFCIGGNRGAYRIEVEDTVQMTLIYDNFSVQITLCFVHKKRMRNFHITGTEGSLIWNEESNILSYSSHVGTVEEFDALGFTNDSMFISQAKHFLSNWEIKDTKASLSAAGVSLAIVEAARLSMINGKVENIPQSFKRNN